MDHPRTHPGTAPAPGRRRAAAVALLTVVVSLLAASAGEAATITVEYRPGTTADVLINGYRLRSGAGAFAVEDGGVTRRCFCVEAHTSHSTAGGAYRRAPNAVSSAALDTLLFVQGRGVAGASPDDLAIATQLLGYHYAEAQRRGGGAIWSDHTTGRAVSPTSPIRWDALPPITATSPVGVRVGGVDRDDLEALVLALDRATRSNTGLWSVSPISFDRAAGRATVTVRGAAGPVTFPGVARWRVADAAGAPVRSATADAVDGVIMLDGVDLPAGGALTVEVDAPQRHIEYAGTDVQRLACAEQQQLRRTLTVEPELRHVEVRKTADHPALSVAGTTFVLVDADGTELDRVVLDDTGTTVLAPIDPAQSRPPYALRETAAAPGLIPAAEPQPLPPLDELSTDPAEPTTIEVENEAARSTVRLRKRLDLPELAAGLDMAGFTFEVVEAATGTDVRLTTDSSGWTPETEVVMGEYRVAEVGRPGWAVPLLDDGPHTFTVGPGSAALEWAYENRLPPAGIETSARDAGGRDLVSLPGAVVDAVSYTGLLPGADYVATAEIHLVDAAGELTPSGSTGSTAFTAAATSGTVEVRIEVADDERLRGARGVVFQTLTSAANGAVVAVHHDPGDDAQTVRFEPPIATTTSTTTAATTTTTPAATTTSTAPPPAAATTTTSTTSAAAATTTAPPTSTPAVAELPGTGASTGGQLAVVLLLVAIGAALVELSRRTAPDRER